MKCIINGKVILKDRIAENLCVVFDKKIEKLCFVKDINLADYEVIDAKGKYVSPGLVDMHIHGYLGRTPLTEVLRVFALWLKASSKTVSPLGVPLQ
jgi:N-acetylglucosamine-6-phosphate deacetylase